MVLAIISAVLAALLLRPLGGTVAETVDTSFEAFSHGLIAWWRHTPEALTGLGNDAILLRISAGVVLLISVAAGIGHVLKPKRGGEGEGAWLLMGSGVAMVVLPAALQWPVVGAVLFNAPNLGVPENLRFYYFTAAGFALIAGAGSALASKKCSYLMLAATAVLCSSSGVAAHDQARSWALSLRPMYEVARTVANDLSQREFPSACVIQLEAPSWVPEQRQHSDSAIKALSPINAPVQNCAIFAGRSPSETLAPVQGCTETYWHGLKFAQYHGRPLARITGDLCTLQFDRSSALLPGESIFHFLVSGDGRAFAR